MFSWYYWQSVEQGRQYQERKKGWAGNDVKKYKHYIKDLVQKYQASTMLDYGSGRGDQYSIPVPYPTETAGVYTDSITFDQYIGVKSVQQYDPCVSGIDVLPELSQKFDCVICTQVLGSIPDADIPEVIKLLATYSTKFCFVSLLDPAQFDVKIGKTEIYDPEYFKVTRTKQWYFSMFQQHWRGARRRRGAHCYLFFRAGQAYNAAWIKQDLAAGNLLKLG